MSEKIPTNDVRTFVRERYGRIAEDFSPGDSASCCEPSAAGCCGPEAAATINLDQVASLYETPAVHDLPEEVTGLSLGCGDPVTLANLEQGQTVLDLGSGGGIDCFLAARQVGPDGHVIGVDMTPAMIEKARANQASLGLENVEFRLGEIEHLPVADGAVDVILSNCVINLSPDKLQVLREAFRALRPGGTLSVSDIVTSGPLPDAVKQSLSAWAGCVAGALEADDYLSFLEQAGFMDISVEPIFLSREMIDEAVRQLDENIDLTDFEDEALYRSVFSARITARKPSPNK